MDSQLYDSKSIHHLGCAFFLFSMSTKLGTTGPEADHCRLPSQSISHRFLYWLQSFQVSNLGCSWFLNETRSPKKTVLQIWTPESVETKRSPGKLQFCTSPELCSCSRDFVPIFSVPSPRPIFLSGSSYFFSF